ncbi:putative bifunctional diguanylate cyclase/phosphodiesterase [Cognatilysobacter segetis]|uniref:putative bifunctional diguanylate cyclase/phosphodiesterase n=1 Tax=Cognatilysobacter segetis TaxID=2492394 RepID=UPI00138F9EBA|nr:EAL domain-containing protein [Lysobacter segetis]
MAPRQPPVTLAPRDTAAHLAEVLRGHDDPLRIVFDHVQDVVYLIEHDDGDYRFVAVNPAFLHATGLAAQDVVGRPVDEVIPPPSIELVRRHYADAIARRAPVHWEEVTPFPSGLRYGEVMVAPVLDDDGRCTHLVGTVHDVTEHRVAQQALDRLANYDPLTGLPNRVRFRELLAAEAAGVVEHGKPCALLYLDLDGFKTINDALGHSLGDALLQQVGERLRAQARPGDILGRLGGDEFGLVAAVAAPPGDARTLAETMLELLRAPFQVDGHEIRVTPSIGIATCPEDSCDAEDLVRFADAAMYAAKAAGRNRLAFYSCEMDQQAQHRRELEHALREAVERREFVVHYQPSVELRSGRIAGFEALLRWNRPDVGLVSPAEFMPVLEDTGLIRDVGDWVIETVVRQLAEWEAAGHTGLHVAINVSAVQLLPAPPRAGSTDATHTLLEHVRDCLARYPLRTGWIELEVTESVLMTDPEFARATLERLRTVAGRIHVDDFGTGYSSLAYLTRLPIDSLKIDRVFVQDLPDDVEDASIVRAVIGLAHSLGLDVIAEGIETAAQRRFLIEAGCDHGQGYLFARPVPAGDVPALLRAGRAGVDA